VLLPVQHSSCPHLRCCIARCDEAISQRIPTAAQLPALAGALPSARYAATCSLRGGLHSSSQPHHSCKGRLPMIATTNMRHTWPAMYMAPCTQLCTKGGCSQQSPTRANVSSMHMAKATLDGILAAGMPRA
jgi:hypothetical protein